MTTEHKHEWTELGKCIHSGQTAIYEQTALGCACGAAAHRTDVFNCGVRRKKGDQANLLATIEQERDACPARAYHLAHKAAAS